MSKLEKMLKYVSEHNDFYKNRIKEYGITNPLDITHWPVLTRKELQENRYNMFSDGYKSKYYNQQLIRQSSSGSSGIPINVYWDYKDWYASNMSLWRKRLQWYGVKPSNRYVTFTLNSFGESYVNEPLYCLESKNNLSFNVSLAMLIEEYKKIVNLIESFEPDWLYIQPFVLNKLVLSYECEELMPPKSLKYIESVGEILSDDLKRRADDLFQCNIANMYGSEEMNGIAIENPDSFIEILNENIFFEVYSATGINSTGLGNAVITNLNNHAMPLIRYTQDDEIISAFHSEKNTNKSYMELKQIRGRVNESIKTKNGLEINSFLLSEIIAEVNNTMSDVIIEYKYIYKTRDGVLYCDVVLKREFLLWSPLIKSNIISTFQKKTKGQVNLVVNVSTDPLFKTSAPKWKMFEIEE